MRLSRGLLGVPVERPIKGLSFDLDVKPYLLDDLRDRSNSIIERRVAEPRPKAEPLKEPLSASTLFKLFPYAHAKLSFWLFTETNTPKHKVGAFTPLFSSPKHNNKRRAQNPLVVLFQLWLFICLFLLMGQTCRHHLYEGFQLRRG